MTKIEQDEQGTWEVTEGARCTIRQLVEPSQEFLDWQASNPVVEPEPVRDLPAEIDSLETRVALLEAKPATLRS